MAALYEDPSRFARRPPNAFLIFCKKNRSVVRKYHPNVENRQITRLLGDWWTNLDPVEKGYYVDLSNKNKEAFFKAHPDFKWYKLPAPPLRRLPTIKKIKDQLLTKNENFITPGKLADESQLGGLASLLTPPKPPNKRYLELNYYKSEEGPSDKNLMSFDYTPFCEVKEEPKEEIEEEKLTVKTDLDSEDSGLSSMSSSVSINSSKIRISCDDSGICDNGSSEQKYISSNLLEVSKDSKMGQISANITEVSNKNLTGAPKYVNKSSVMPIPNSPMFGKTLHTSQQVIIDCVVDNSFKNVEPNLISNYNCSTKDPNKYYKLGDEFSGTNNLLNDNCCIDCGKDPSSKCDVESSLNANTCCRRNKLKTADSTSEDFGEINLKKNNEAVTSLVGENQNDMSRNTSDLMATYNNSVNNQFNQIKQEKLDQKYENAMGSSQMDVDEHKLQFREQELGRRQSKRLKLRKERMGNAQIKTEMETFPDYFVKRENYEHDYSCCPKIKSESFEDYSTEVEMDQSTYDYLEYKIKYDPNFILKCEEKYNLDYNVNFEKEIEELPVLNFEEYQQKKKAKRKVRPAVINVMSDHDYIRTNREPIKRRTRSMKFHDNNNNLNSITISDDESEQKKYSHKKRVVYNRHLKDRDARGSPKATASIGGGQFYVKTQLSSGMKRAQARPSTSGSGKRKAPKQNIHHLKPGSSYRDTAVIQEAALALLALSGAAHKEMNLSSN